MKKLITLLAVVALPCLSHAKHSDFEGAVQSALKQRESVCTPLGSLEMIVANQQLKQFYGGFVSAGFLKQKPGRDPRLLSFELTELGKTHYLKSQGYTYFCYGNAALVSIDNVLVNKDSTKALVSITGKVTNVIPESAKFSGVKVAAPGDLKKITFVMMRDHGVWEAK